MSSPALAFPIVLHLSKAWLCVDCDAVTNESRVCPHCLSTQLLNLANVLDRAQPISYSADYVEGYPC